MRGRKILIFLLRAAGIALLLFPVALRLLSSLEQSEVVAGYEESLYRYNEKMVEEELEKAREYNDSLTGTEVRDPFIPGSGVVVPDNYEEILDVDRGMMGTLEIPAIDLSLPIYHGVEQEVLEKGVGHLQETPLPIGGEGHHTVLSTHRGLPEAKLFTNLDKLAEGDEFYIRILNDTLAYRVDQIRVVEPEDTRYLKPEVGKDYVTLLTCTPYGINSHRLLVRGIRTDYVEERKEETKSRAFPTELCLLLAAAVLLAVWIGSAWYKKKKKRDKTR